MRYFGFVDAPRLLISDCREHGGWMPHDQIEVFRQSWERHVENKPHLTDGLFDALNAIGAQSMGSCFSDQMIDLLDAFFTWLDENYD